MKISVIIVSYNSDVVLRRCLQSIEKYNDIGKELEVIVVDNYEKSSLSDNIFSGHSFKSKYIRSDNRGFGAGNNLGVLNSEGDILFFLNPDTELIEPIFSDVFKSINENRRLIYGFSLVDLNMNPNDSFSFMYDNFLVYHILAFLKKYPKAIFMNIPAINKRMWAWGAAFAVSRQTFVEAGQFDENIFLCNEEADLMHRIEGRKIYISSHRIIHLEGHGVPVSEKRMYEFFKSREYYFAKYHVGSFNLFLWKILTYLQALRNSKCKGNESRLNYYKAYQKFVKKS